MSEYQYYEWQTIERPLTEAEQAAVYKLSSHIEVSATQAVVTYEWGDFKHDPRQVLARYFDANFYWANWGTRILMFRFPLEADLSALKPYYTDEFISLTQIEDVQVLEMMMDDEPGEFEEWDTVEHGLSPYTRLRNDILQGDYRALYIAWLGAIRQRRDDPELAEELEPPVPPGLKTLNAALKRLVELFGVETHLLQAAAAASGELQPMNEDDLRRAVEQLARPICNELLLRLARGETGVTVALQRQLQPYLKKPTLPPIPRTVGELLEAAQQVRLATRSRQAEEARKKHLAEMKELAKREPQTWQEVERIIESGKSASVYDQATKLLDKLKQLSDFQDTRDHFRTRLHRLAEKYAGRHSLIRRWREKGWV
jgi:hypothetical protein